MKNKVGIIGFGNVGTKHFKEFLKYKKLCKVVAICDFDKKKILRLKKEFKDIKIYKNSDDLINDKTINTVSICTYDHFHMDQIIKCFKNNKNVFCEKPLCFNYDQFKILKKKLPVYGGYLGTNFNLRTSGTFQSLKKKIKRNKMGKIFHLEAGYESGRLFKIKDGWRGKNKDYSLVHGGMIHMIDLVMWLLEFFEKKRVYEILSKGNNICSEKFKYKNHDFIASTLKTDNIIINLKASWGCVTPHFHSLKVYGTKRTFINDFRYKGYFLKNKNIIFKKDQLSYVDRDRGKTIKNFLMDIFKKNSNKTSRNQILKVTELAMAIQKSLIKKKMIKTSI